MPTRWATTAGNYNDFMDGIRDAIKVVAANNTTAANGWRTTKYDDWVYGNGKITWDANPNFMQDAEAIFWKFEKEEPKDEPLPDFDGEALDELAMTVPGESA